MTDGAPGGFADEGNAHDVALLNRHLAGDSQAFTEIMRRHRDHLWAIALRTTGDPEDAADALQDGLISAMRHAASFRGDAKLSTWLHRIVVNACLDKLRRRAAHPTSPLPDDDRAPSTSRDEFDDRDTAADVAAALATLPADQRAAIVLVDIEGYPVAEAAAILEVPAGTVKSRCARGRVKLVPLLAHLRGIERYPAAQQYPAAEGNPSADGHVEPQMNPPREDPR